LFEGDRDLDVAIEINTAFGDGDANLELSHMIHQTDMLAPPEARAFYGTAEYASQLDAIITAIRQKLDTAGLGDRLLAMYRGRENEHNGKYRVIVVGALMMRAGAKIRDEDLQHLRDLVPDIHCVEGYAMPIADDGFRGAGKRQFLAALDHYRPGVPRSFADPSCFACGKISADIGKSLDLCSQCKKAWYCNKVSTAVRVSWWVDRGWDFTDLPCCRTARRVTGKHIRVSVTRPGGRSTFSARIRLGLVNMQRCQRRQARLVAGHDIWGRWQVFLSRMEGLHWT
jgi:hypothetical protein